MVKTLNHTEVEEYTTSLDSESVEVKGRSNVSSDREKPPLFTCKGKDFYFYGATADVREELIFIHARKVEDTNGILMTLHVSNPLMALRTLGVCLMTIYEDEPVDIVEEFEMRAIEVKNIGAKFEELTVEKDYRYDMATILETYDIRDLLVTSKLGVALGRKLVYADLGGVETSLFVTTSLGVLEINNTTVSDALYEEVCNMAKTLISKREVLRV